MKTLSPFIKNLLRFLVTLFSPLILIVLGGLLIGWSIENEYTILAWTGLVMVGAGIIWGLVFFIYHSGYDWS